MSKPLHLNICIREETSMPDEKSKKCPKMMQKESKEYSIYNSLKVLVYNGLSNLVTETI